MDNKYTLDVDPVDWKEPAHLSAVDPVVLQTVPKPKLREKCGARGAYSMVFFFVGKSGPFVDLWDFDGTYQWDFCMFKWDIMRYDKIWMLNSDSKRFIIGP